MSQVDSGRRRAADAGLTVLALGSLWGFSEVVLAGLLGAANVPYRSAILTAVGIGLMAVALAMLRKPVVLAGVALVAILCKQLVVPILHVSLLCKANSVLAVAVQSLALAGVAYFATAALPRSNAARVASGATGALVAAGAFYVLGIRVAPCQYLSSFARAGGLSSFLVREGLPWALVSALLFPLGYRIGERLSEAMPALRDHKPALWYAANALVVAACWLTSAFAIAAGL